MEDFGVPSEDPSNPYRVRCPECRAPKHFECYPDFPSNWALTHQGRKEAAARALQPSTDRELAIEYLLTHALHNRTGLGFYPAEIQQERSRVALALSLLGVTDDELSRWGLSNYGDTPV